MEFINFLGEIMSIFPGDNYMCELNELMAVLRYYSSLCQAGVLFACFKRSYWLIVSLQLNCISEALLDCNGNRLCC